MSIERMQCPRCGHSYALLRDLDEHIDAQIAKGELAESVTSETTAMAIALSDEVDELKDEVKMWRSSLIRLAANLPPRERLEVALMAGKVRPEDATKVQRVFNALTDGIGDWTE